MSGRIKARLFLTSKEQESLLDLMDELELTETETMEDWERVEDWKTVICRIIFGKHRDHGKDSYPISSNVKIIK